MAPAADGDHAGDGGVAEDHAAHVLAQAPGRVHELGGQLDEVAPAPGLHPVPEGGELQHLGPEVGGVVGVDLPGEELQVLRGQPQGLAQVLDDALHRVGGDGPGEDRELGAEVAVHAADELVAEAAGEVQVDVGEQGTSPRR